MTRPTNLDMTENLIVTRPFAEKIWEKVLGELKLHDSFHDMWDDAGEKERKEIQDHLTAYLTGIYRVNDSSRPQTYTRAQLGEAIKAHNPNFNPDAEIVNWVLETQLIAFYFFLNYDLHSTSAWVLRLALQDLHGAGCFTRMSDVNEPEVVPNPSARHSPAPGRRRCRGCHDPEYTHASYCPNFVP